MLTGGPVAAKATRDAGPGAATPRGCYLQPYIITLEER